MKTASLPDPGTIETDIPEPGEAGYQQECFALYLRQVFKNLYDEGFAFNSVESSDLSSFSGDVADGLDDYIERYEEILLDGASEITANIPDVLPIMAALVSGGSAPVLSILLQGVLDAFLRNRNASITQSEGETLDTSELVDAIRTVLNEFTINIIGDLESQSWSVEPVLP